MLLNYNIEINDKDVLKEISKLINKIYQLLPLREEGADWELPLSTIFIELSGMDDLLIDQHDSLFPLLCKLKGLETLGKEEDFFIYRRTVFECLNLLGGISNALKSRNNLHS